MPAVHALVDELVAEGLVRLNGKFDAPTTRAGPHRIGQIEHANEGLITRAGTKACPVIHRTK